MRGSPSLIEQIADHGNTTTSSAASALPRVSEARASEVRRVSPEVVAAFTEGQKNDSSHPVDHNLKIARTGTHNMVMHIVGESEYSVAQLPPNSIALDLTSSSTHFGDRWTFARNALVFNNSSKAFGSALSTQIHQALEDGFRPAANTTLLVNQLNADTALSSWLLRNPGDINTSGIRDFMQRVWVKSQLKSYPFTLPNFQTEAEWLTFLDKYAYGNEKLPAENIDYSSAWKWNQEEGWTKHTDDSEFTDQDEHYAVNIWSVFKNDGVIALLHDAASKHYLLAKKSDLVGVNFAQKSTSFESNPAHPSLLSELNGPELVSTWSGTDRVITSITSLHPGTLDQIIASPLFKK